MPTLGRVQQLIEGKSAKERATLKGIEIAKIQNLPRQNVKFSGADYDIEIVQTLAIDGGVSIFARVWNPDGSQIGFGKDGTVDIERFRFFNPPIMVPDGTKSIIDIDGKDVEVDNLKEDPEQALFQSLAHTIKVKKQSFGSEKIVNNRVGNTTDTYYSSMDGYVQKTGAGSTWASFHDASAGTAANTSSSFMSDVITASSTTDTWSGIKRCFILFDTAAIDDADTIDSATLSLYPYSIYNGLSESISIVGSTPASETALVTGDFDQLGTTRYASDIEVSSLTNNAYNDFLLNATGESNINLTGKTKFGAALGGDTDDSPPTWISNEETSVHFRTVEQSGSSADPKLVVEHSVAAIEKELTETSTWTDSIIKSIARAFSEASSHTDALTAIRTTPKTLSESSAWTDVFTSSITKLLTEVSTWTDSILTSISRTLTEASTWTDSVTVGKLSFKTLTESSVWTDIVTTTKSAGALLVEAVSWTDTMLRTLTRTLTETSTWTDALTTLRVKLKTLTDSSTWTDVLTKVKAANLTLTEAVTWTDKLNIIFNGLTAGIWKRSAKPTDQSDWDKTDLPDS